MSDLKSTLSGITSFLPDNLFGLKKYIQACKYASDPTHLREKLMNRYFDI